jgi:REP element-mobilizing transposase RayT
MLAKENSAYGGLLLKTRAGRLRGRPLSTKETMHLVLRSSKAKGDWSFRKPRNATQVNRIIDKFSVAYGVRVISMANVGNHLHLQIKLSNRFGYVPFIRAVTAAIAMAVTGRNRWSIANSGGGTEPLYADQISATCSNPHRLSAKGSKQEKFWDCRPFTRVIEGFRAVLTLRDYIRINQLEGAGNRRLDARFMLQAEKRLVVEDEMQARFVPTLR